jgi:DNA polymerase (family 10)
MSEIPNAEVAARLSEAASLLAEQGANPYRVRAYQSAAELIKRLDQPIEQILRQQGVKGLETLPGIGKVLALAVRDIVHTGRLPMAERLRGESDPLALLSSIPGIGEATAMRLHRELGIDTLEELEQAAHSGKLEPLRLGAKRIAGIRDSLAQRLGQQRRALAVPDESDPPVAEILDVDREYRDKARAGLLPRIAPRRFNPGRKAWLPILHTHRPSQQGDRHYTALFSNTASAHERGMTGDWVVLYYDGEDRERQCTVVTAPRGPQAGRRIVRGREAECRSYYAREGGPS